MLPLILLAWISRLIRLVPQEGEIAVQRGQGAEMKGKLPPYSPTKVDLI